MFRTRQLELIVCLLMAAGAWTGCALSAIDGTLGDALANQEPPPDAGKDGGKDGGKDAAKDARQETEDEESDEGEEDDDPAEDAGPAKDASAPKDAAAPDAGKDSGVDAGKPDAGPQDAGGRDSGTEDSGTQDSGTKDAGTEPVGECSLDSDCKKICLPPFGILNCCKADHSCGCTTLLGTCS